jgi:GNAT superfamily N-acetyltransferase
VHWVVTEFGSVNLHGLNVRERAMALISIADPRFRPWLMAEAKRCQFIYTDQLELPLEAHLYPQELESRQRLRDSTDVLVRAIKPTDESLLRSMFYRLSEDTVYKRFSGIMKYMPHKDLQRFCTIDYVREVSLVATVQHADIERIMGLVTYSLDAKTGFAEIAMVVDDAFQRRGIGKLLMRRITKLARERGLKGFTAFTTGYNGAMVRVFESAGCPIEMTPEGPDYSLRILFESAPQGNVRSTAAEAAKKSKTRRAGFVIGAERRLSCP